MGFQRAGTCIPDRAAVAPARSLPMSTKGTTFTAGCSFEARKQVGLRYHPGTPGPGELLAMSRRDR